MNIYILMPRVYVEPLCPGQTLTRAFADFHQFTICSFCAHYDRGFFLLIFFLLKHERGNIPQLARKAARRRAAGGTSLPRASAPPLAHLKQITGAHPVEYEYVSEEAAGSDFSFLSGKQRLSSRHVLNVRL